MTTTNDEHADLGRLVADYEATHERVLKLRARLARTAGIWTNFVGILNQNPEAVRSSGDTVLLGDNNVMPRSELEVGQVLHELEHLREAAAHERELERRLDEADKRWIVEGLRNRRVSRDAVEQRDLLSRRA
ncbi:MAG: hypothetical protein OXL37_03630 [Chloroflexota bacterium]|nr:hypothetical protein [Chloroflexota bacterium]MDE2958592.1 hypothetical protein [Chloroflexota bacterium]